MSNRNQYLMETHPIYRAHILTQYQQACQNVDWAIKPYVDQIEQIELSMPKTFKIINDCSVEVAKFYGWPQWAIDSTEQMLECIRYVRKSIMAGWGFPDFDEEM